ncbi:DDE-type integrase/transposase/recombinase [Patescibacteria group bacterium]|nr:DDE-type integrase/transposase/recombinase [Patescibacteria group bacterium]
MASLIPQSTRPQTVRQMQTHPLALAEICRLRRKHYRLGKHKLYPLVKRYCEPLGVTPPQESTIGKIIKRNHIFYDKPSYGYHDPNRKRPEQRKKTRVTRAPKPEVGGYIELDTIETIIEGIRRYTITAIDVKLKVVYAQTFTTKHAKNALVVLKSLAPVLPVKIHTIQTDNGSEFEGLFDKYCKENSLTHKWTYPHSPKINGVIERFNRSIQEEWLDMYQDEMLDINLINQKIKEYLYFYHHDRIHESLSDQTPATVIGYNINYSKSPICV